MSQKSVEIILFALSKLTLLIQATQPSPQDLGTRSLIYDTGPWKGGNLLEGIENFFQKNAYHPYTTCSHLECGKTGPIPLSFVTKSSIPERPSSTRSIEHFCKRETCFEIDPTHLRSTRHLNKDISFLDKAEIFEFRTIAIGETIRKLVNTFREFHNLYKECPPIRPRDFL